MRLILFPVFLLACLITLAYAFVISTPLAPVLCAIWALIALVALVGRAVLDALHRLAGGHAEPRGEPGDRGGAYMPPGIK